MNWQAAAVSDVGVRVSCAGAVELRQVRHAARAARPAAGSAPRAASNRSAGEWSATPCERERTRLSWLHEQEKKGEPATAAKFSTADISVG